MCKHGGTPPWRDKHATLAGISPPGVARGRFVGGHQSGLAGSKPPPLFTCGTSSCSSHGRHQGEPWGASPRPSAPTYLPLTRASRLRPRKGRKRAHNRGTTRHQPAAHRLGAAAHRLGAAARPAAMVTARPHKPPPESQSWRHKGGGTRTTPPPLTQRLTKWPGASAQPAEPERNPTG